METLKSYIPLNFALMANPVNWIIVALMIAIAGYSIALIFNSSPSTATEGE